MFLPTHFPHGISDRLLALASALVVAGVLMATAIVPASPAVAAPAEFSANAMGVLA